MTTGKTFFTAKLQDLAAEFWLTRSFDELAIAQDVKPLVDVDPLLRIWPGDVNDGFEESIRKLRQSNLVAR